MQTTPLHISILLDRSGSMASIADDVVGGFNSFLEEQRRQGDAARVTLVQFDGQDPFEVLVDGQDLRSVESLDPRRYVPRGNTPLLDAVGLMVARLDAEIVNRADQGQPIEDQLVVVITDGFENASREFTGTAVRELIRSRRDLGWTFVFLAADEASVREGVSMGTAPASAGQWASSPQGTRDMFSKLSKETSTYRTLEAHGRRTKSDRFLDDEDDE